MYMYWLLLFTSTIFEMCKIYSTKYFTLDTNYYFLYDKGDDSQNIKIFSFAIHYSQQLTKIYSWCLEPIVIYLEKFPS